LIDQGPFFISRPGIVLWLQYKLQRRQKV